MTPTTIYVVTAEIPDYWDGGTLCYEVRAAFHTKAEAEAYVASFVPGTYEGDRTYEIHETTLGVDSTC